MERVRNHEALAMRYLVAAKEEENAPGCDSG
jgi:hypothetical protein